MDYEIYEKENRVVIENAKDFALEDIFECGQAFRWNKQDDGSYTGIARNKVINIKRCGSSTIFSNTNLLDFNNIWYEYFDMGRDYSEIKEQLSKDDVLREAIKYGEGIRILKQDVWETLISFIISANNRIPMIKRAINNISKKWGNQVLLNNEAYYTFPGAEIISSADIEELEECGTGFRAKYIKRTADMVVKGEIDLSSLQHKNYNDARSELMNLPGVGPKVSDCILLFGSGHYEAFPVDIWVKRVMQHFYVAPDVSLKKIEEFAQDKFGKYAGFAQQYLFYYARSFMSKELK